MSVYLALSISVDGFIAGPDDSVAEPLGGNGAGRLHEWLFNGDTPSRHNDMFSLAEESRAFFDRFFDTTGAIVTGRRTYDVVEGWHGNHPFTGVPVYVVTHAAPERVPEGKTPFHFVTDGAVSAIGQATAAARGKDVGVMGAATVQQALQAGLLDEIHLHVVPVLLGDGVRLFDHIGAGPLDLERTDVVVAPDVTHLSFRVRR